MAQALATDVDIALFDSFAPPESDQDEVAAWQEWSTRPQTLSARDLVAALSPSSDRAGVARASRRADRP